MNRTVLGSTRQGRGTAREVNCQISLFSQISPYVLYPGRDKIGRVPSLDKHHNIKASARLASQDPWLDQDFKRHVLNPWPCWCALAFLLLVLSFGKTKQLQNRTIASTLLSFFIYVGWPKLEEKMRSLDEATWFRVLQKNTTHFVLSCEVFAEYPK